MSAVAVVEQSVAAFALHALWQVPLLAGAAWCAVRLGCPQARVAHAVWVATLVLCVLLPVGCTVAARHAALAAERDAQVSISYDSSIFEGDLPAMQRQPAWKRMLHRHVNSRDGLQPFAVAVPQRWARVVTVAWLLVIAFFSAQLVIGWMRVRALVRGASNDPLPHAVATALQKQCERLGMTAPPTRLHERIAGPVLAGVARPTLLLPWESAGEMSEAEVDAVLAHELAHLRRRDPLVHAACSLLLLPVCFHPAALWAARCVRQTREMACDAEAAQSMGSHADYAWALLQVAERTNTEKNHATAAGFFSNGLFGAGLQLFTNRGAMEERMGMLMNGNRSKVRPVRLAAGLSLTVVAVVAASMLQVQPTLAAERSLPQAVAATQQPTAAAQATSAATAQESEPRLIGGEHAREQLRRAQRQLRQAEAQATTADDRKKIEGAQQVIAAAEQALIAADASSGPRVHVDLSGRDHLEMQLNSPEWKAQLEKQHEAMAKQLNSPEWKAQFEKQHEAMAKLQAQMNSPEWKAQMQRMQTEAMEDAQARMNSPEFKAQMEAARKVDQARINALMAEARRQQEKAMEQFRSGAIQRQIEEARLMARVDPAPMPAPFASPAPHADQGSADKTLKVSSGVMAGNKVSGANPVYPPDAKEKRIMGTVVLHAIINKTGKVEAVQVVSSPDDSLSKSAVAAVQTWVYRPYLLNGEPMAVDTTVNVNFSLVQ